jgi:hypothetical protein
MSKFKTRRSWGRRKSEEGNEHLDVIDRFQGKDLGFNIHLEFRQYKFAEVALILSSSFDVLYQQIKPSLLLE